MDALITVSGFDDESAAWDAVTGKINHLASVLLRLQYKSHCIRRHTKFLSEIYIINIVRGVMISGTTAARGLKFWLQVALSTLFTTP